MTQNDPDPRQPSQPWSADGSGDGYRLPTDPWGEPDHSNPGGPVGGPPAGKVYASRLARPVEPEPQDAATAGPTAWTPSPPAPRRSVRRTSIIAVAGLAALLACGGLGGTAWYLTRAPQPSSGVADQVTPTPTRPTPLARPNPALPSSLDARFVGKGQCVRNDGTPDTPEMTISVCASGAYVVLARLEGRTTGEPDAEAKCAKVANYSKWYFYDSDLDSLDFVLCLREW